MTDTDQLFAQALALHAETHRKKQQTAGATGHYDISGRCMAIADAAEQGYVLAPINHPADSAMPDFYTEAARRGLLVDEAGRQVPYVPLEPEVDTRAHIGNQPLAPKLPDGCPGGG